MPPPPRPHFVPPVSLGPEDIAPAVAALACGLARGGCFRTSLLRRQLQTVIANFVAATDLSGLPPYGAAADVDGAWTSRFHIHPQTLVNLLNTWQTKGAVVLVEDGRDRLFRMRAHKGMARFMESVVLCEEGLRSVRPDLLLLSLTLPTVYPYELIARSHPALKTARARIDGSTTTPLAECWRSEWILERFLDVLQHRRTLLLERAAGVGLLHEAIAPFLTSNLPIPEALQNAHARLPSQIDTVYPGLFAWKRQRAKDLDSGLDRLAVLYGTLPEEVARRDFLVGMPTRSNCLYLGMAAVLACIMSILEDTGERLKRQVGGT